MQRRRMECIFGGEGCKNRKSRVVRRAMMMSTPESGEEERTVFMSVESRVPEGANLSQGTVQLST